MPVSLREAAAQHVLDRSRADLRRIDGCDLWVFIYPLTLWSCGVAAMAQNIVAGCVAVALIILALIGYAQKHHQCWNGHVVKNWRQGHVLITRERCGYPSPSI